MHSLRVFLLLLPQLLAISNAQTLMGMPVLREANAGSPLIYFNRGARNLNPNSSSSEETTKPTVTTRYTTKAAAAFSTTTNIFNRFLIKSTMGLHTTRSGLEYATQTFGTTLKTTTEGIWLNVNKTTVNKTTTATTTTTTNTTTSTSSAPSTSTLSATSTTTTKRSFQPTYFNILTKYTTIPTAPTKTTEITAAAAAAAANTTMIIPTTSSSRTLNTTTEATTKFPATTEAFHNSTTIKRHPSTTHRHLQHSGHNLTTTKTTIKSIAKAELPIDLKSNGCGAQKLHLSMAIVLPMVLGSFRTLSTYN